MPDAAQIETIAKDLGEKPADIVRRWKLEIELAEKGEVQEWRKRARQVISRYRDEKERQSRMEREFNILLSNTETLKPAVYSKTPVPDVRRRFADPRTPDPVAREASIVLERTLSHSLDDYDFDGVMNRVVSDFLLPGRGIARVKYVPTMAKGEPPRVPVEAIEDVVDAEGNIIGKRARAGGRTVPAEQVEGLDRLTGDLDKLPENERPFVRGEPDEEVVYEQARCEYVYWEDFGFTPARVWDDVRAVWFRSRLTRKQLKDRFGELGDKAPLDWSPKMAEERRDDIPDFFKRATVYEVWDKEARKVIVVAPAFQEAPLAIWDDFLKLEGFFPVPEPLDFYRTTDSMVPLPAYIAYQDQALELDTVNNRIAKLVRMLKVRGVYDGAMGALQNVLSKGDGELVAVDNYAELAEKGGLDRAISLIPLRDVVEALRSLYEHREILKQTIFELTGISDIMRGQTDPGETKGAQSIKAQFGQLRHRTPQAAVEKFARDLLRLKAEIIAEHFSKETLQLVSGVQLPSAEEKAQAAQVVQLAAATGQPADPEMEETANRPSWDEVMDLLKTEAIRGFRIDVESESTIVVDSERAKREATEMIKAVTEYVRQAAETLGAAPQMAPFMVELLKLGLRQFKPGRLVEEQLDQLTAELENMQPQQEGADPAEEQKAAAEQAKAEAEQAKLRQQAEIEAEKLALERRKAEDDAAIRREEIASKESIEREKLVAQHGPSIVEALERATAQQQDGISRQAEESQARMEQAHQAMLQGLAEIGQRMAEAMQALAVSQAQTQEALSRLGGEKEVVFRNGRPVGVRPVEGPRTLQ